MANKTKKSKQTNRFGKLSGKSKIIIVVVVAIIGAFTITGSFAESRRNDYTLKVPTEQTTISLTNEKPLVISKDSTGKKIYESRGKSIDVTVSGTVYCTPENNGQVKIAYITPEQLQSTEQQIEATQPNQDTLKQNDDKANIGNTKQLLISESSSVEPVETNLAKPSTSLAKTEQVLDKICAEATTVVSSSDVPVFIPENADSPNQKQSSLKDNYVLSLLLPKTYAANASKPALSTSAENDQLNRINQARKQYKKPLLSKSECLTKAARTWSLHMATVNRLYHSPLDKTVEKTCGSNWWAMIGENVGVGGNSPQIFEAYMNSPGHKANILRAQFQRMGVGAYTYKYPGKPYVLLWTAQLFADCIGSCANK